MSFAPLPLPAPYPPTDIGKSEHASTATPTLSIAQMISIDPIAVSSVFGRAVPGRIGLVEFDNDSLQQITMIIENIPRY